MAGANAIVFLPIEMIFILYISISLIFAEISIQLTPLGVIHQAGDLKLF